MKYSEKTLGSVLDDQKQFGKGFDFLRIFLAILVIATHSVQTSTGTTADINNSIFWLPNYLVIVAFFALSGFLVAGSAQRLSLKPFLAARVLRIAPALAVEILLSALIVGPLLTSAGLAAYFTDPTFFRYLGNMLGLVSFQLPGVFLHNPLAGVVNGALWTIPYEILCYVLMSGMMLAGVMHKQTRIVPFFLAVLAVIAALHLLYTSAKPWTGWTGDSRAFILGGIRLLPAFALGCLCYVLRYRIPFRASLAGVCLGVIAGVSIFCPASLLESLPFRAAVIPLAVYVAVFFGLVPLPKLPVFSRGDYSYGLYLYHFPVQQMLVQGLGLRSALPVFVLSLAIAVPIAMVSWHWIEKPILKLRHSFSTKAREAQAAAEARAEAGAAPASAAQGAQRAA